MHDGSDQSGLADGSPAHDVDLEHLERYLAGELGDSERAAVAAWVDADPARGRLLEALGRVWDGRDPGTPLFDAGAMWSRVYPGVARHADSSERARTSHAWPRHVRWMSGATAGTRIARVAVPVVAVAAALMLGVMLGHGRSQLRLGTPERELMTGLGQRLTVTLLDGTRVTLASSSYLRIPIEYGRVTRTVVLRGEAYFDVAHDATHPFTVQARDAEVRDIGTSFDVRDYANDSAVRVAVVEGQVCLGTHMRSADRCNQPLRVGDVATVASDHSVTLTHDADVQAVVGWTTGQLTLRNAPFGAVISDLERLYGLEVHLADATLGDRRVTARLREAPVDQILTVLASTIDARFERSGRVVTFIPRAIHP